MNLPERFLAIQHAMLALRARRPALNYAVAVEAGRYQLQVIEYAKRKAVITPLTDWTSAEDVLSAINRAAEN